MTIINFTKKIYRIPFYCFTLLLLSLAFYGCQSDIEVANLRNGFFKANALQLEYAFDTDQACNTYFNYWTTNDPDKVRRLESLNDTAHQFILLPLLPNTQYEFQVEIDYNNKITKSQVQQFTTGMAPPSLPKFDVQASQKGVFEGLIMVRNTNKIGHQILINENGDIVWYHRSDTALFRPFSVLDNNTYLALSDAREILELNLKGDTLWAFDGREMDYPLHFHHEIIKDQNDNYISLTRINEKFDLRRQGGEESDEVKGDGIVVIAPDKSIVWEWNIFDHVDPSNWEDIDRNKGDWSHANAINIDTDGHYLVSFRSFDQIWKIHNQTGEILWKLGVSGDFTMEEDDYFFKQHAVHINANGHLMLFDNLSSTEKTSRALAFEIDEELKTAKAVLKVPLPDSLHSAKQGSAFLMDDDKVLFAGTSTSSIIITNLKGEILWYAKSDKPYYRAVQFKWP